jgi:hypothetical protein
LENFCRKENNLAQIDPLAAEKIEPELMSGETIYWAGKPNPGVIFHSGDWMMIPFSLLWEGFAIFWESMALGIWAIESKRNEPSGFIILWGVPFVLIGQFMIWGRCLVDGWLKRRAYYALTNRRAVIVQEGWKRKTSSAYLESVHSLDREGELTGTLWFGPKHPVLAGRGQTTRCWNQFSLGDVPVFADIEDLDSVYRLV